MTRHELHTIMDFLYESVETIDFPGSELTFRYIPTSRISEIDSAEDHGDYAQRTLISPDYSLDDLVTLLSDGLAMECGFESVDYNKADYEEARDYLTSDKIGLKDEEVYHELIEAQMILMGKPFGLVEVDTGKIRMLTIEKILKGLELSVADIMKEYDCSKMHAICELFDNGDFFTYNAVLQNAVYNEVRYG